MTDFDLKAGETVVYFVGNLSEAADKNRGAAKIRDRFLELSGHFKVKYPDLPVAIYEFDKKRRRVHLTQRRLGPNIYEYRATGAR